MGLALVTTFAFSLWVVLTALGLKSFDGFLLGLIIIVTAAGGRMLAERFSGRRALD